MAQDKHYHAVQFYKDDTSLARTVATFFVEGLRANQPAIMIATRAHTKAIMHELGAAGYDTDQLKRAGQLHTLDVDAVLSTFMVEDVPDTHLFRANVGRIIEELCEGRTPCPVRAYGEMVDQLWQAGNRDGAIRLEMLWNQLARAYDFSLLCGYSFGQFYKETRDPRYQDVVAQHTHVLPA
jgi:hypothetical protein